MTNQSQPPEAGWLETIVMLIVVAAMLAALVLFALYGRSWLGDGIDQLTTLTSGLIDQWRCSH